ncbi:MAG TPA: ABC transporter permease [Polaromonas sp.]|uniref:ABC transporter permease n=1 Tax=Polaromonas sp. UBA4122 TaxID=1947074 RepID=UPI000EC433E3|nr:ABC transporter permease [Polaromonas sp. UBA4122]HAL36680.1 ABC transporter permease [Polaromonas sp.]
MIASWFLGLIKERNGRLVGSAAGIAVTVAMLASLGAFLAQSTASMTRRAVTGVPVDWQVQLVPGTTVQSISTVINQAAAVSTLHEVGYAEVDGFEAHTGGTVQTTGKGKVVGVDASYARDYPKQFRALIGSLEGVLVAQQTAANLHVMVGDIVTIHRPALAPVNVTIAGVVDLPNADSMFQAVGIPVGAAPQAPPDNVLLMPLSEWHRLFDPQAAVRPDAVRIQLHVGLTRAGLPRDPGAAFVAVQGATKNLEVRIAGSGIVANNLAARLDAVRSDALYAKVLFLFLGAPGALLATFLTIAVVASGGVRRRRDQALLRIRGASRAQIMKLATIEAAFVGVAGPIIGVLCAALLSQTLLGVGIFNAIAIYWVVGAVVAGISLSHAAILATAWMDAKQTTVAAARMTTGGDRPQLWRRIGLDFILIAVSAIVFSRTWSTGYQVVLAPEGTPSSSVDYTAFLAPVLLWLGVGLLTIRLCLTGLQRGRGALTKGLRPIAGSLAGVVAAAISRQGNRMTQGIALVALAFAFATSTAVFNTTYHAQTRVDAELTNGADVTVTGTAQAPASVKLKELAAMPGVSAAQPMQHRLAYVGTDLQDLYGIDAAHIGEATRMSSAYFAGGDARQSLDLLGRTPDGILVSAETVKDFQLKPGDLINLRLQSAVDHQYHVIPFRFIGIVREFPTAPRDSFLVANAAYISRVTGANASEIVLLKTAAASAEIAAAARTIVAPLPGVKVTELGETLRLIGSSLTAVDLGGLTRLELGLAVLMVTSATGLILALGLADRRRTFAILSALGAKPRQLGAFLWSEALLIFLAGTIIGTLTGFALAWMLVKLLTGAFDPPPEFLSVPWVYVIALIGVALVSVILAVISALRETRVPAVQRMREI